MIVTEITKIGDPQILLYDGVYYCYATSHDEGFMVWESDDLVHWQDPVLCFKGTDYWAQSHFWAPEVVEHQGKFYMHYTGLSRESKSLRLGVAVADHPKGPFVDVHNRPMFDLGYATIDGSVLKCPEGNFFYYSRDCGENVVGDVKASQVYCVQLDDTLTNTVGEHRLMTTPDQPWEMKSKELKFEDYGWTHPMLWNEGPCVIFRDGKYIMNYSANYFGSNDYSICVATADHPMGPWKKSAHNPVLSRRGDLFGAGHNAFFTGKDGKLYTSFHIQTDPAHPSANRRTVIGQVDFTEKDGEIVQTIE
ncbi:MAG: glycosidase [Clostridiales bacterium]|nr:glycosidase [Clostridiales bacterium]